jgi:hypothetical protein
MLSTGHIFYAQTINFARYIKYTIPHTDYRGMTIYVTSAAFETAHTTDIFE